MDRQRSPAEPAVAGRTGPARERPRRTASQKGQAPLPRSEKFQFSFLFSCGDWLNSPGYLVMPASRATCGQYRCDVARIPALFAPARTTTAFVAPGIDTVKTSANKTRGQQDKGSKQESRQGVKSSFVNNKGSSLALS